MDEKKTITFEKLKGVLKQVANEVKYGEMQVELNLKKIRRDYVVIIVMQ